MTKKNIAAMNEMDKVAGGVIIPNPLTPTIPIIPDPFTPIDIPNGFPKPIIKGEAKGATTTNNGVTAIDSPTIICKY